MVLSTSTWYYFGDLQGSSVILIPSSFRSMSSLRLPRKVGRNQAVWALKEEREIEAQDYRQCMIPARIPGRYWCSIVAFGLRYVCKVVEWWRFGLTNVQVVWFSRTPPTSYGPRTRGLHIMWCVPGVLYEGKMIATDLQQIWREEREVVVWFVAPDFFTFTGSYNIIWT